MEAAQATLLAVAIRIVYDSGRDLLKQILERRRSAEPGVDQTELEHLTKKPTKADLDRLLHSEIPETRIAAHSDEIEHLTRLVDIYRVNYQSAKEKAAMWGVALVPPIILHELEDAEQNLANVLTELRRVVNDTLGSS